MAARFLFAKDAAPPMYATLEKAVSLLARLMAYAGGAVLICLIVMTCVSITGRALVPFGLAPIKGDFEWIELGVGFAIFAFLPWCQLQRGHAAVDLLQGLYGRAGNRVVDVIVDVLMFGAASVIAWRLYLGMQDKLRFGETTFILQFPVWIGYAAGLVGACVFVIVAAFCILRSGRALVGRAA